MPSSQPADLDVAGNSWTRFWFTPIAPFGLRVLRVLSGLLFFCWLMSFVGHQAEFFSLQGWFDRTAFSEIAAKRDLAPAPIGWSMLYLADNDQTFNAMYYGSLAVLALFTLGIATRITGILTWIIVVSFLASPATSYEGDYLLGILAFYMMLGHLLLGLWSERLSWVERVLGSRHDFVLAGWLWPQDNAPPSYAANWTLRLLQIHTAIILVTSGLHKLNLGGEWWSGIAFWYPMHDPFKTSVETLVRERENAQFMLLWLTLTQYLVLAWQLGFPTFAWRTGRWRFLLIGGAIIGWLGAFFLFKLPLFGPFVFLCCLSYLRPEEWAWFKSKFTFPASTTTVQEKVGVGASRAP